MISRLFTGKFGVSAAFIGAFDFPEISIPLAVLGLATPLCRGIVIAIVYSVISAVTFFTPNVSHRKFEPSTGRAILCVLLTFYSILSLTGVSTFIYSGF